MIFEAKTAKPAPKSSSGILGWLRDNLFDSWINGIATVVFLYLIYLGMVPFIKWAFIDAVWSGDGAQDCKAEGAGACWLFVQAKFDQLMYGFYPESAHWRIHIALGIFAVCIVWLLIEKTPYKAIVGLFTLIVAPIIGFILLRGGYFGLEEVETSQWGGLTLTLILAGIGIVLAFPLGIILALGRRSDMPVVRNICIIYIEFWRGVPLITVLFMVSVMLPLAQPATEHAIEIDKVLRALVAITLFQSAYMAEVVRGGLQAIPKGQYEAAAAMGLGYWKSMMFIIMPQALRLMIPAIVNTCLELFKDTSLVIIISLLDILGMIQAALTDTNWPGFSIEGYLFVGAVYFIFCYGMSLYSRRLEARLDTGHK